VADRSTSSGRWVGLAFLAAWLAGALYIPLCGIHVVFGVPWQPVLGAIGAVLFLIFIGGFAVFIVGCGAYQLRVSHTERRPVTWREELVGWVVPPAPDESGTLGWRWQSVGTMRAAEFLAALRQSPEGGLQVFIARLPCRIEPLSDEAGQTSVRWYMSRHTVEPGDRSDGR